VSVCAWYVCVCVKPRGVCQMFWRSRVCVMCFFTDRWKQENNNTRPRRANNGSKHERRPNP